MTLDEFFTGFEESRILFDSLYTAIGEGGLFEMQISKSQIAFTAPRPFAWVWVPGRYLRRNAVPLVLSISLPRRDDSPRWKEISEPARGRFMHHLELRIATDIDDQVVDWLKQARTFACR